MTTDDHAAYEGAKTHDQYRFTTIDYTHPDPALRCPERVSVYFYTGETQRVAGVSIEVGR